MINFFHSHPELLCISFVILLSVLLLLVLPAAPKTEDGPQLTDDDILPPPAGGITYKRKINIYFETPPPPTVHYVPLLQVAPFVTWILNQHTITMRSARDLETLTPDELKEYWLEFLVERSKTKVSNS